MQDYLAWVALLGAGASLGAIATFWMTLGGRITTAELRAQAAEARAESASRHVEALSRDLAEHKVSLAAELARAKLLAEQAVRDLAETERRLVKAIDDVGDRLDSMNEKLDRVLQSPRRGHGEH